jgi:hypothetical protein
MRILFDRNVEPRFVHAIESTPWATVTRSEDHFPPDAPDEDITDWAEANDWVIFTRDNDFFRLARDSDCGLLFLHKRRDPNPGTIADAVARIDAAYTDHEDIEEGLPGNWAR